MKIEIWESKEKKKIDVLVDPNGIGWVKKKDFDYTFGEYKKMIKSFLMLAIGFFAMMVLALLM